MTKHGLLASGSWQSWETALLPGKQVRAFRGYDQKLRWRQPVPPAKAREPYE